ncbi:MAG: Uma2 family endonuclease [Bryobacterales bacterium]|nr:Uma2 family endonuclease [Bryobacterales bacterium]MBV9400343.1 Uma2 family endonuclease [Bryobacterales bacterium]
MTTKTLLTADELEQMPDDDSVQIELDEGELIRMPPAGEDHGYIEGRFFGRLLDFVIKHKLGRVYTGDTGFRLNDATVRSPDVAFVRAERVPKLRAKGFAKGAPDLAIEIKSESQSYRQLQRKIKQYFAAGCQVVLIVNRDLQEIDVFKANGSETTLRADDLLEIPDLLPGFSVRVGELFE